MTDVTFMVKTLLRPDCLAALLASIRQFYPEAPIWIADDSPEPYPDVAEPFGEVSHYHPEIETQSVNTGKPGGAPIVYASFPYDIGIGHCYNWMVDRIPTPYVVLLDDDFVFTERTKIERFLPFLRNDVYDLVGGEVWNERKQIYQGFCGFFFFPGTVYADGGAIHLRKIPRGHVKGPTPVEVTMNFFAVKTEVLRDVRWDETLKVCRHEDFFLRFNGYRPREQKVDGYRAAFYPGVVVSHVHLRPRNAEDQQHDYAWHRRGRFGDFREIYRQKWGFEFQ